MKNVIETGSGLIQLDRYDRSIELNDVERAFVSIELPRRIKFSRTRQPELNVVRRLIHPLDDVFDYIHFCGAKRKSLLFFLLEEMGRRQKSFWGWADNDWVEVVNNRRYDGNRLIAVAYLLCGFRSLDAFGKRRQVFFRLAQRVFGSHRFTISSPRWSAVSHLWDTKPGLNGWQEQRLPSYYWAPDRLGWNT